MRKLFQKQLERARRPDGSVDLAALEHLIVLAYDEAEQDRARTDRSIRLMVSELSEMQAELEKTIARRTDALKRNRTALREQNTRFAAALQHMKQGLSMFDKDQKLVICNQQYLDLYGLPKRLGRRGTTFRQLLKGRVEAGTWVGNDPDAYVEDRIAVARAGERITSAMVNNHGKVIAVSHEPLPGGGWVSTHEDVTELHTMQKDLERLAYFDPLTSLPNRNLVTRRLGESFFNEKSGFALMFVDLDEFKTINDTLGAAAGDRLLQEVAWRLGGAVRHSDLVGRLGSDEFAVVASGAGETEARALAVAVERALARPFELDGQPARIGATIGIALATADGADGAELFKNAGLALHAAKRDRRGSYRFFEQAMDEALRQRRKLEQELREALEDGQFELYYQPILDLRSQTFTGFEALLRWHHPVRGMVSPADFIPVAEEIGLIAPIGEWVIREAFAEAARWPSDIRVAVNVSSAQFGRGNLVNIVFSALAASGLAPHRVELEITESVFLADSTANLDTLRQLHMLGVRIALDDFGTGYSALSYLLSFPFDKIKIDGSFVRALDVAEGAHTIIRAVSEIGNRMGMTTTAEGVETAEQLRNVHALGYTEAQGYLISRPVPVAEVHRMVVDGDAMPEAPLIRAAVG